jgi:hypothetical protein
MQMTFRRRLKRERRLKPQKGEQTEPIGLEELEDRTNPFKRLFPWDFPGQVGDWLTKRIK